MLCIFEKVSLFSLGRHYLQIMDISSEDHPRAISRQREQEIKKVIVERILGDEAKNPVIHEMSTALANLATALKCDADAVVNNFLPQLTDLNVQMLSMSRTEQLIKKQEEKLEEINQETKKMKDLMMKANLEKKRDDIVRKDLDSKKKQFEDVDAEYKEVKSKLVSIGFRDELCDANIKYLEKKLADKKEELDRLQDELAMFEGLEPNVNGLRMGIMDVRKQMDQIEANLKRMSVGPF